MATNEPFDWRSSDRRLFLAAAIMFPLIVLIGFGRTYYLKMFVGTPALPSTLVHIHGLIMTAWVVFFIVQVWLIRSKNARTHMSLGMLGIALAILIIVVGFFTGAAAAKNGSASAPPDIPSLAFFIVPFLDLVLFALFFGAAIYYRKRPADHKRLMLLTVINFLPPAVARIPIASLQSLGPLVFFGVPSLFAIGLIIYDTRRTGKLNRLFLIGSLVLIASYPLRIMVSGTDAWMGFAAWVTTWAA
jgi:hypothetical protein